MPYHLAEYLVIWHNVLSFSKMYGHLALCIVIWHNNVLSFGRTPCNLADYLVIWQTTLSFGRMSCHWSNAINAIIFEGNDE
jgi:hypothetical protein